MEDIKVIYVDTLTDCEPELNYFVIDSTGQLYRGQGTGVAPLPISDTKYSIYKGDYRTESATTTLLLDDGILEMTAVSTVNLYDAGSSREGQFYIIKNSSAGVVTLDPNLAQTIEGAATYSLGSNECVIIASNQTEWKIVSKFNPTYGNLQQVTDAGNTTTNQINADLGFWVMSGATPICYLADDGTVYSNGQFRLGDLGLSSNYLRIQPPTSGGFTAMRLQNFQDADGVIALTSDIPVNINDLTDVIITTPSNGQVLKYNGTNWVNGTDLTGAGGGATQIEQNLSATPTWRGKFTVVDALISSTSKISIWQAFAPLTGKGTRADENEMDSLIVNAESGTGQMTVYWQTQQQYTMSPPDPQGNGIDTRTVSQDSNKALWTMKRLGKVKGNFKFNYTIN